MPHYDKAAVQAAAGSLKREEGDPMKEVKAIEAKLTKLGYQIRELPNGHHGVWTPEGERLVLADGRPLHIPSTASDWRTAANLTASLKQAGVDLNGKPAAGNQGKGSKDGPEWQARVERANGLRARLVALMHDHKLSQGDVYRFWDTVAKERGLKSPKNSQTAISGFIRGAAAMDVTLDWAEAGVEAIEAANGNIPRLVRNQPKTAPAQVVPQPKPTARPKPKAAAKPKPAAAPAGPRRASVPVSKTSQELITAVVELAEAQDKLMVAHDELVETAREVVAASDQGIEKLAEALGKLERIVGR